MNLTGFLAACGGKPSGKPTEWVFDCWECSGKQKLYFNTTKLVGFCQKCARPVSLRSLAAELGGVSIKDIQKFVEEAEYNDRMSLGFKEAVLDALLTDSQVSASAPKEVPLPPTFRTLRDGANSVIGKKAIDYLSKRGFNIDTLISMGFGYCSGGYYADRIIIPFWENGRMVYWQARDFTKKVPPGEKILNPLSSTVSIGKSSVLFNYDGVKDKPTIAVCESWGSALATGACATGLNGKNMSNVQMAKLLATHAKQFLVLLDHGAEDAAWKVAERLSAHRETLIAFLPYGDPAEVPRSVLLDTIARAQPYSAIAALAYRARHL